MKIQELISASMFKKQCSRRLTEMTGLLNVVQSKKTQLIDDSFRKPTVTPWEGFYTSVNYSLGGH